MSSKLNNDNLELGKSFKERIKILMTEKELEQPFKFASRVGLPKGTFSGLWNTDRKFIHRGTAEKIAAATGASIQWLQYGIGEPFLTDEEIEVVDPPHGIARDFWKRFTALRGTQTLDDWLATVGIDKAEYQHARQKGSRPASSLIEEWAAKIGVNYTWLLMGHGIKHIQKQEDKTYSDKQPSTDRQHIKTARREYEASVINTERLQEAFSIIDGAISDINGQVSEQKRVKLAGIVYNALSSGTSVQDVKALLTGLLTD